MTLFQIWSIEHRFSLITHRFTRIICEDQQHLRHLRSNLKLLGLASAMVVIYVMQCYVPPSDNCTFILYPID